MWRRLRDARDDQRGAVALLMVGVLAILMVSSAFVVDLGLQRVARADAQAVADMVALDLARELDGRTVTELRPVLDERADESAARNSDVVGAEAPQISYELGTMGAGGFSQLASGVPTAVRVRARTDVGFAFSSVTGKDSGGARRSAAAESSSTACFRLGSFVAAIRSGDSTVLGPLNDLLGVNLDLVSYRGLADADLTLDQLSAVSTIGSPEELLTGSIQYTDLLSAMVTALELESPGANEVAIEALGRILRASASATVGAIHLANVLHVAPTDRAALDVALNVLDLVGTARLADGQYFLGVPNIQGQVPGVGFQFTGAIYLVSAAELACGAPNTDQAKADTAQLDGTVGINFTNLPSMNVPGLGTLQTPKGTGSIQIVAGHGEGALVAPPAVRCGAGTVADPSTFGVEVETGLASYKLTTDLTVGGEVKLTDLLGLGLLNVVTSLLGNILTLAPKQSVEVQVSLSIGTKYEPSTTPLTVRIPPNDTNPVSTGGSVFLDINSVVPTITSVKIGGKVAPLVPDLAKLTTPILHELVDATGGFVRKSLVELVENINEDFIGPAARMIGLRLAGADVYGVGVTCGTPRLVG